MVIYRVDSDFNRAILTKIHLCISEDKKRVGLIVDGKQITDWFKQKYEDLKVAISQQQNQRKGAGIKL